MSHILSRRSLLLGGAAAATPTLSAAVRPNILLVVSDDQRHDTIHELGNSTIITPTLDRLAKQGVAFTNAYVSDPICTPSRACLLSGVDDWHTGVRWFGDAISPQVPVLPETLQLQGYETFFTGKWHNDRTPEAWGFTKTSRVFSKGMGDHEMSFDEGGKTVRGHSSQLFADAAIRYLQEKPKEPFFAMVSFTSPHDPRTPPEHWKSRYNPSRIPLPRNFMPRHPFDNGELEIRDEKLLPAPRTEEAIRKELALYYGMISSMDEQLGRILHALDSTDAGENTIVVFTSDNGLAIGSHGLLGKMSMYDHSVRVPLIFRLPGKRLSGKKVDSLCYNHQIFGTVCDVARVKAPTDVARTSLAGQMERKGEGAEAVFASYRDVQRMVRTQEWKLIWYPKAGKWQLFRMKTDPDELDDLSGDGRNAGVMKDLTQRLHAHMKESGDPLAAGFKPV